MNGNKIAKWTHRYLAFIMAGLLAACSLVYNVSYDYDRGIDFGSLQDYHHLAASDDSNLNRLDRMRIEKAVDAALQVKGFKRSADHPDFLITPGLIQNDIRDVTGWGYGYAPYGIPWRGPDVYIYEYEESTLVLEVIAAGSKELLWQGRAKARLDIATTPEKRDQIITEAVGRILSGFPPPAAGH